MNRRNSGWSFIDFLTLFDTYLQMADYQMNMQQSSNDDIMQALERQNKEYFEKIIANQKEILSILSKISEDMSAKQI